MAGALFHTAVFIFIIVDMGLAGARGGVISGVTRNSGHMDKYPSRASPPPFRSLPTPYWSIPIRAKKFRFDSILATESIFFDSIRYANLINLPLVH